MAGKLQKLERAVDTAEGKIDAHIDSDVPSLLRTPVKAMVHAGTNIAETVISSANELTMSDADIVAKYSNQGQQSEKATEQQLYQTAYNGVIQAEVAEDKAKATEKAQKEAAKAQKDAEKKSSSKNNLLSSFVASIKGKASGKKDKSKSAAKSDDDYFID